MSWEEEVPLGTAKPVRSPYVPINFTNTKLLLDTASTPAGHLTNVPLAMHNFVSLMGMVG